MAILMLSVLLFVIFHHTVSSLQETREYAELRALGGSCYPHDTCSTLTSSDDDHLWDKRTCECGPHCAQHGTCCIDSPYVGYGQQFIFEGEASCRYVQNAGFQVLMVSNCSAESWDSSMFQKCDHAGYDMSDPLSVVPVTSLATGITYKNYFCALCNNDLDETVLWNIEIPVSPYSTYEEDGVIPEMEYNADWNMWGTKERDPATNESTFRAVSVKFVLPPTLKKIVKKCNQDVISYCNFGDIVLVQKCLSYRAPVKFFPKVGFDNSIFRNVHCALCNGLRLNEFKIVCDLDAWSVGYGGASGGGYGGGSYGGGPSMSFALLLDVNPSNGDKVGLVSICKNGQVFDPFFRKCRTLSCALPNFVIKNGSCVDPDQ